MLKLLHVDTETTGKDPRIHAIHQLAGSVVINGEKKESFDIRISPWAGRITDPAALAISGVTFQDIRKYPNILDGVKKFVGILAKYVDLFDPKDKFFMCGYGVSHFDFPFVRSLFEAAGGTDFGNWFYTTPIDSMGLAAHVLRNERANMPNFKLETVAARFNISVDKSRLHQGDYDVLIHEELYEKLCHLYH